MSNGKNLLLKNAVFNTQHKIHGKGYVYYTPINRERQALGYLLSLRAVPCGRATLQLHTLCNSHHPLALIFVDT